MRIYINRHDSIFEILYQRYVVAEKLTYSREQFVESDFQGGLFGKQYTEATLKEIQDNVRDNGYISFLIGNTFHYYRNGNATAEHIWYNSLCELSKLFVPFTLNIKTYNKRLLLYAEKILDLLQQDIITNETELCLVLVSDIIDEKIKTNQYYKYHE